MSSSSIRVFFFKRCILYQVIGQSESFWDNQAFSSWYKYQNRKFHSVRFIRWVKILISEQIWHKNTVFLTFLVLSLNFKSLLLFDLNRKVYISYSLFTVWISLLLNLLSYNHNHKQHLILPPWRQQRQPPLVTNIIIPLPKLHRFTKKMKCPT